MRDCDFRAAGHAYEFIQDVYDRLANRVQITSDGHGPYTNAIRDIFSIDVDDAQLVKVYGTAPETFKGRYSSSPFLSARKTRIEGRPDPRHVSTSYVERQNLTMRTHMRRFTRQKNGFSKKVENDANAVALHFAYYNLAKVHKTLRVTPAMAAGVTDKLWEMADRVAVVEASQAKPGKRGPYRKRAA